MVCPGVKLSVARNRLFFDFTHFVKKSGLPIGKGIHTSLFILGLIKAKQRTAVLALEDGSVFRGFRGPPPTIEGEGVFNTGMTGYQETSTDPSYYGQIVTMTTPQIGNYGITDEDEESRTKVAGFQIRELSPLS